MEENIVKNQKYFCAQVNSSKAYRFTCQYHYSQQAFKGAKINLGIFKKENNLLVGVLQWGRSASQKIRLDRYVKEPININEYLELNRFCMADSEERNSESQAISLGIKWLKKNRPDIRLLVSYAGRKEGNYGYIYQATNWEYLGYFISPSFWVADGLEIHYLTLWTRYNRSGNTKPFMKGILENYNSLSQYWSKQFIYIQRLDKHLTPANEILSYPKLLTDFPIVIKTKVYKDGGNSIIEPKYKGEKFYYKQGETLFSRKALIDRGEIIVEKYQYAQYGIDGILEKLTSKKTDLKTDKYLLNGINNSIKSGKKYKDKYFKQFLEKEDVPQQIEVEILGWIDEIPFYTMPDIVKYTGLTRQAVQQSRKNNGKKLGKYLIIWNSKSREN